MGKITYRGLKGYKYELLSNYSYQSVFRPTSDLKITCGDETFAILRRDGFLTIFAGYCWDGPSGPTIDTKNFMRGSLIHDVLYQMMRQGILPRDCKPVADKILHDVCREDGMSAFRAWYVYQSVLRFAGAATLPNKTDGKTETAP